jgi:hypothetical protein
MRFDRLGRPSAALLVVGLASRDLFFCFCPRGHRTKNSKEQSLDWIYHVVIMSQWHFELLSLAYSRTPTVD